MSPGLCLHPRRGSGPHACHGRLAPSEQVTTKPWSAASHPVLAGDRTCPGRPPCVHTRVFVSTHVCHCLSGTGPELLHRGHLKSSLACICHLCTARAPPKRNSVPGPRPTHALQGCFSCLPSSTPPHGAPCTVRVSSNTHGVSEDSQLSPVPLATASARGTSCRSPGVRRPDPLQNPSVSHSPRGLLSLSLSRVARRTRWPA